MGEAWAGVSRGIPRGQEALKRLTAFEQLAGSYLGAGLATSLSGESQDGYAGFARFSDAIARWDLQAHRTMAAAATPSNLASIARTQAMVHRACLVLMRTAAHTGVADPSDVRGPDRAGSGGRDGDREPRGRSLERPDQPGRAACGPAAVGRRRGPPAAMRELIHDKAVLADPTLIAQRADLREAAPVVAVATAAGVELACAARGAANDTSLAAPGSSDDRAGRSGNGRPRARRPRRPWESVGAGDLHHNRLIPLIAPVRDVLARSSAENIERASYASSAVSAHWRPRSPAGTEPEAPLSRHAVHVPSPAASLCGPAIPMTWSTPMPLPSGPM